MPPQAWNQSDIRDHGLIALTNCVAYAPIALRLPGSSVGIPKTSHVFRVGQLPFRGFVHQTIVATTLRRDGY